MFNKNAPYFGILNDIDPEKRETVIDKLSGRSISPLVDHTIASDVVEEIVRRGGRFYTADEARQAAPFRILHNDVFCASYKHLPGEPIPSNPAYAETDWIAITIWQYCYGMYLTGLLNKGTLTLTDLIETAKAYV